MAHARCMLDKQGYMHVRVCSRPHARLPTRTHGPVINTYCFSTATMIRERASVLRYTNVACLVVSLATYLTLWLL